MKPRVLIAGERFRLVNNGLGTTLVEKRDGRDFMGVPRWVSVNAADEASAIVRDIGRALRIREKRARKARARKSGGGA